jgi:CelD/BcsL family acetyltransferase involved in cellulose biosynthesis
LAVLGVFNDGGTLVGLAPWYVERTALHGRVLRFLGSGKVCSDYMSILCHPSAESAVIDILSDYLVQSLDNGLRWDLLDLEGVDAEDRTVGRLVTNLATEGCSIHRRSGLNCWRLELPTHWDTYLTSLSRNLRRDFRRLDRDLISTHRAKLHSVTCIDALPEAMAILVTLHQRRRKMLGESGCFISPQFLDFYNDVVPELFRRGQVQLHWLEIDGCPVASEFQLVGDGTLYTYQAGIAPDALAHQPGKLIYFIILRRAIEQGYRAFDFLRGDEPYKARFGAQARPSLRIRIVPPAPAAQFRHHLWLAGFALKNMAKQELQQWGFGTRCPPFDLPKASDTNPQSLIPNP